MTDSSNALAEDLEPQYVVYVRLSFPRNGFVDPPLIDWTTAKDDDLWQILSRNTQSANLDWHEIASRFQVPVTFILQQAAWLYERQLSQVKAQMRRAGDATRLLPPVVDDKASSAPSERRHSQTQVAEQGADGAARQVVEGTSPMVPAAAQDAQVESIRKGSTSRPAISRNASAATVTQSRMPARPVRRSPIERPSSSGQQHRVQSGSPSTGPAKGVDVGRESSESSSSSEDDSDGGGTDNRQLHQSVRLPSRGILARRPPTRGSAFGSQAESDEDDHPAFLPFHGHQDTQETDLGRTIVGEKGESSNPQGSETHSSSAGDPSTTTSESSAASGAYPRNSGKVARKDKGRGSTQPSLGSSYSDLDGAWNSS